MIRGVHTMFYSSEPEALRAFLRDKLGFPFTDVGGGWLIFDLPEADMGCHPIDKGDPVQSGTADISFYCDNIEKTVSELRARGVEFTGDVADHGYGLVTYLRAPGNFKIQLYEPRYVKRSRIGKKRQPSVKKPQRNARKKAPKKARGAPRTRARRSS